ncbi:LAMI_0F07624g1_1 [Lachancea mirantina]|uniref:LAMI_0F07624g1_1 n=1 Tax=Lachancea mirantina TaxID=1230905 RepID=A0A1G4JZS9_9SACH|nr:LAMI_0F07624g1_1 [Lachancea mirantina]
MDKDNKELKEQYALHVTPATSASWSQPPDSKKRDTEHVEFVPTDADDDDGEADSSLAGLGAGQGMHGKLATDELVARFLGASEDAQASEGAEKSMSLLEGLRQYPRAALWSVVLSTALIMEGYDTALLQSLYALPAFAKRYGFFNPNSGVYEVPARWQTALSMSTNVGEVIGLQLAGIAAERIGYRWTLISSLIGVFGFIFILFFAPNCGALLAGEVLCGIPWGCFQTLTVTYATEVCPLVLRFYLTTWVNICWVLGQIMASGVLKHSQENLANSAMAYRLPFALQWIWPLPLALGIYFAPESPWWQVRKERYTAAERSLSRLISNVDGETKTHVIKAMLERMRLTTEKERKLNEGVSYWDCLKGVNGRRTRIACLTWVTQNACGSAMMGFSTYFYEKAGLSDSYAFNFTIIQYCLGLVGTLLSWVLSKRFGRYTIFAGGLALQAVLLLVIGGLGFTSSSNASWAIGTLLLVFVFAYDIGVGPVTYCIVPEIPSSQMRTKTVVLARNCYNLMGIVNYIWTPYMLNSDEWNWGAKTGLFWGAICVVMFVWAYLDLPETKGRTFGEIDELFAQKVPARRFRSTEVDPFDSERLIAQLDAGQLNRIADKDMGGLDPILEDSE